LRDDKTRLERQTMPQGRWVDSKGSVKPITPQDILVVAPYNAQIALLEERLGKRSTPWPRPRRRTPRAEWNSSSRAQCACILVASPRLFEPECKTPLQMPLANALCRYAELAQVVVDALVVA
jgi:hypothetical protein